MLESQDAKTEDLKQINQLIRLSKAHWGYDREFMDHFMEKFGCTKEYLKSAITKIYFINNELIAIYSFSTHSDGLFELDYFLIHPDYIGKGLGRELWHACCTTAQGVGKDEFILWSDPNAENFYLKMGCDKIGTRKSPLLENRYAPILKFKIT